MALLVTSSIKTFLFNDEQKNVTNEEEGPQPKKVRRGRTEDGGESKRESNRHPPKGEEMQSGSDDVGLTTSNVTIAFALLRCFLSRNRESRD